MKDITPDQALLYIITAYLFIKQIIKHAKKRKKLIRSNNQ